MRNYSNEYKKIASFENLIFSNVSILKGLYIWLDIFLEESSILFFFFYNFSLRYKSLKDFLSFCLCLSLLSPLLEKEFSRLFFEQSKYIRSNMLKS